MACCAEQGSATSWKMLLNMILD